MTSKAKTTLMTMALLALAGCGVFKASKPKTPVLGNRIPVLMSETDVVVDPTLAEVAVTVPDAVVNTEWAQPGGEAAKSLAHVALAATPSKAWSASIPGGNKRARLAATPVILNGKLYVVDVHARLHAFDAATGAALWTAPVGDEKDLKGGENFLTGEMTGNSGALFGGGVSAEGDRLYATNGLGDVVALNAADGSMIWKKRPGGPLRGAPTLSNGNAYVISQDNQLFALRESDGNLEWTASGTVETAGVFGVAAPAAAQGTVVAGFSSGELNAYRYENGRPVWQDALSRTTISTSVASLSDIDADPVIDQGRVYAVGQGGRMIALELVTGQRLWELNLAGISTPWVAGEWLFVVTDDSRLLCIARTTGKVRWVSQLKRFRKVKKKDGAIAWSGPVLAGGHLVLVSSRGEIVYASPATGAVEATVDAGKAISMAPVVANSTLYVLDDDGKITAWR